jgi:hypothetical protein
MRLRLSAAHELPEELPEGENVLWQGAPGWWAMARSLHIRLVGGYFAILLAWFLLERVIRAPHDHWVGLIKVSSLAGFTILLFAVYALLIARTSSYTITNRRLVLQVGVALPISFNIPFDQVQSAAILERGNGSGDIVITLGPAERLSYVGLWPHVRSGKPGGPAPMLRALTDVAPVSRLLSRLLAESVVATAAFDMGDALEVRQEMTVAA